MYRWVWERHARPHLGHLRVRDLRPLDVARFRADLEADGIGVESIRKTLTMLGSVFSRAVEWELVPANPIRAARKPPSSRSRTLPAIGPDLVEAMRARLRSSGRERDAVLLVLLAYAGLRPGEALALEWRHVRERTLVIEQAVADGQLKVAQEPAAPTSRPSACAASRGPRSLARRRRHRRDLPARRRVLARDGLAIAAQLGHNPTVCLDVYGHEMTSRSAGEVSSAEDSIRGARRL